MSVGVIDPASSEIVADIPRRVRVVADRRRRGLRLGARPEGEHADDDRSEDDGGRPADPRDPGRRDPDRARRRRGLGLGRREPGTQARRAPDRPRARRAPATRSRSTRARAARCRSCARPSSSTIGERRGVGARTRPRRGDADRPETGRRSDSPKATAPRRRSPSATGAIWLGGINGVIKLDPATGSELGNAFVSDVIDSTATSIAIGRRCHVVHGELPRASLAASRRRATRSTTRSRSATARARSRSTPTGTVWVAASDDGSVWRLDPRQGSPEPIDARRRRRARFSPRSTSCGRVPARRCATAEPFTSSLGRRSIAREGGCGEAKGRGFPCSARGGSGVGGRSRASPRPRSRARRRRAARSGSGRSSTSIPSTRRSATTRASWTDRGRDVRAAVQVPGRRRARPARASSRRSFGRSRSPETGAPTPSSCRETFRFHTGAR